MLTEKPGARPSWAQWSLELASLLASTALLVGMAVMLSHFDGAPVFDNGVFTLNAIVSVLSTAMRAMQLFVLASAVSQWNWLLFAQGPRRLCDFDRVAEASRGPWGSVQLLFNMRFRGGALVRFGALLTLLSIALDPLAQQLVQLDQVQTFTADETGSTGMPRATRYAKGNRYGLFDAINIEDGRLTSRAQQIAFADADFALQSAVMLGITTDEFIIRHQLAVDCPSGECRFPPVTSLAVCSRCADLTSQLEKNTRSDGMQYFDVTKDNSFVTRKANSTEYRLPNGLFLNNQKEMESIVRMASLGTGNNSMTVTMGDVDTLIWSQSMIKLEGGREEESEWPDIGVSAAECALYYCAKKYYAEVHNSTLFEWSTTLPNQRRIPESWAMDRDMYERVSPEGLLDEVAQSLAFHPLESSITRTDLQLEAGGEKWNISQAAVDGVSVFMQGTFAACIQKRVNCTRTFNAGATVNGYLVGGVDGKTGAWAEEYEPSVAKAFWDTEDFEGVFEHVAMSMSNAIRNGGNDEDVRGKVGALTTVYMVFWPWIALHCVTTLGTLVFLLVTVLAVFRAGGQVPVWKGSGIATMTRGPVVAEYLKGAESMPELDRRAKKITVSLLGERGGGESMDDQMIPLADRGLSRESDIGSWR